jgi:hypothetical protein
MACQNVADAGADKHERQTGSFAVEFKLVIKIATDSRDWAIQWQNCGKNVLIVHDGSRTYCS